jgi:transposase
MLSVISPMRCPRTSSGIRAFASTSATFDSWLNMVERFFAKITRKRIRRRIFKSVDELEQAIRLSRHIQRSAQTLRLD